MWTVYIEINMFPNYVKWYMLNVVNIFKQFDKRTVLIIIVLGNNTDGQNWTVRVQFSENRKISSFLPQPKKIEHPKRTNQYPLPQILRPLPQDSTPMALSSTLPPLAVETEPQNWGELPRDATAMILEKVGLIDNTAEYAQSVHRLSKHLQRPVEVEFDRHAQLWGRCVWWHGLLYRENGHARHRSQLRTVARVYFLRFQFRWAHGFSFDELLRSIGER